MRTSPRRYRLLQVLEWRKLRSEGMADRAKNSAEITKAHRAAELYMELDFYLNGEVD